VTAQKHINHLTLIPAFNFSLATSMCFPHVREVGIAVSNTVYSSLAMWRGSPSAYHKHSMQPLQKSGLQYPPATQKQQSVNCIHAVNALFERSVVSSDPIFTDAFEQIASTVRNMHQQSSRSRTTKKSQ
jgi:hypothetical protein